MFVVREAHNVGHLRKIRHEFSYLKAKTKLTLCSVIKRNGDLETCLTLACPR